MGVGAGNSGEEAGSSGVGVGSSGVGAGSSGVVPGSHEVVQGHLQKRIKFFVIEITHNNMLSYLFFTNVHLSQNNN